MEAEAAGAKEEALQAEAKEAEPTLETPEAEARACQEPPVEEA